MYNKPVLVAVDFSKGSEDALHWAAYFSTKTNNPLIIVHVIHDPAHAPGFYRRETGNQLKPVEEVAQNMFDTFLKQALTAQPEHTSIGTAQTVLVKGTPAKRILAVAKKTGAGHIVLGRRGHGKRSNLFVGSVAKRVVKKSPATVTVVSTPGSEATL